MTSLFLLYIELGSLINQSLCYYVHSLRLINCYYQSCIYCCVILLCDRSISNRVHTGVKHKRSLVIYCIFLQLAAVIVHVVVRSELWGNKYE